MNTWTHPKYGSMEQIQEERLMREATNKSDLFLKIARRACRSVEAAVDFDKAEVGQHLSETRCYAGKATRQLTSSKFIYYRIVGRYFVRVSVGQKMVCLLIGEGKQRRILRSKLQEEK